jgi:aerobic-type carbon monoxide dehydrogenase small subunit (CoxS/CutS family)
VVAVRAFLNKNPQATEAEIRKGLNGNICRCGTYSQIIDAAVSVVKGGK